MSKIKKVSTKENLFDWLVYSCTTALLLLPFYQGQNFKHFSISIIVGFLFGMINRIIREIELLREQQKFNLYNEEEVEEIANEMVNWAIDNIGNPNAKSGEKFDEVISKYKWKTNSVFKDEK